MRAMRLGNLGMGFLWEGSKSPSAYSFCFSCSKARCRSPTPSGVREVQYSWYCPSRGKTATRPKAMTFMPFSGRNRRDMASRLNMTQRMAPSPSFREK